MAVYQRVWLALSRKLPRPSLAPLPRPLGRFTLTTMASNAWIPNRYPQARRSDHVDVYKSKAKGSVSVPDPYNWLEENSEETTRWITEQEKYTREYVRSSPQWERIEADIRKSTDYAKVRSLAVSVAFHVAIDPEHSTPQFSPPAFKGNKRWYWYYNSGLQPQSGMCDGAFLRHSLISNHQ